mmetsp:Transcript_44280/g.69309  ORF Transcript_44280/g.69309 Transcript_44280/m.69309 type:complete len:88 (-) Transcript_44280:261-524(-)
MCPCQVSSPDPYPARLEEPTFHDPGHPVLFCGVLPRSYACLAACRLGDPHHRVEASFLQVSSQQASFSWLRLGPKHLPAVYHPPTTR